MNFNLSILSLLLSLTLLICSIFELILMFKKKEFKLFILIIIFLVFGSFTENLLLSTSITIGLGLALTAAIIAIKIIFYQRHKTDIVIALKNSHTAKENRRITYRYNLFPNLDAFS